MSNEKSITLYALSTCIHCKKNQGNTWTTAAPNTTASFVDKLEGEERKQIIEAIKKVNPKLSFPTLLVDEEAIVGFKQDQIKDALER